MTSSSQCQ